MFSENVINMDKEWTFPEKSHLGGEAPPQPPIIPRKEGEVGGPWVSPDATLSKRVATGYERGSQMVSIVS